MILTTVEQYYDTAPRAAADVHEVGPFTVFVGRGWPYYARPRLGTAETFTAADVAAVFAWQRDKSQPQSIEWVRELTPTLEAAAAVHVEVHRYPLLVLDRDAYQVPPETPDVEVRVLTADDSDLVATRVAVDLGFRNEGTDAGPVAEGERDAALAAASTASVGARMQDAMTSGQMRVVAAVGAHGPIGGGTHQPRGAVTELTGIGVLPAYRRRGIGARITAALVADALAGGAGTVFLSAGSGDVARVYQGIGFRRVGTACVAEL
ncbi:MAG: GNAT family N-acetyltransferase [Jatrophihabitans sp.]